MKMQEYCDVYKWTSLRTLLEVKCLHPIYQQGAKWGCRVLVM